MRPQRAYVLIGAIGVALTWLTSVFDIINYASRAFAFYYALQAFAPSLRAARAGRRARAAAFFAFAGLGLTIAVLATVVEV